MPAATATVPYWRIPGRLGIDSTNIPPYVDVAVVGGGLVGLTAALHLTGSGVETVLIDAGQPGAGSSTTGAGVVGWSRASAHPHEVDPRASGRAAVADVIAGAQEWFSEFVARHGLDADHRAPGTVLVTGPADPGPLDTTHPGLLTDGLVASISGAGGALAVDEPIRSISRHSRGFQLLTSKRKITARNVIVATGGSPGPHPLGELRKRFRTQHGRGIVVTMDPDALGEIVPEGVTTYRAGPRVSVVRPVAGNAALLWIPHAHRRELQRPASVVAAMALGGAGSMQITHDWVDSYAATHDGVPRIGRVNAMWYAGGVNDPGLAALLGCHVAGLTIGTVGASPFAEIPHPYDLTTRLRSWFLEGWGRRRRLTV